MDFDDVLRDRLMSHASAGALRQPMPENAGIVVDGRYRWPRKRPDLDDRETVANEAIGRRLRSNMIALHTAYRAFGWTLE